MKKISYHLILLLVSTACTSNPSSISINVTSWEVIEPKALNKKIRQAYKAKLDWASKPELYVFNIFDISDLKKMSYEYSVDNIENPKNIDITVARDGFLDDSVRGDIQHLKLFKNSEGIWKILTIKKAISCWRNEKTTYSSEECP